LLTVFKVIFNLILVNQTKFAVTVANFCHLNSPYLEVAQFE